MEVPRKKSYISRWDFPSNKPSIVGCMFFKGNLHLTSDNLRLNWWTMMILATDDGNEDMSSPETRDWTDKEND